MRDATVTAAVIEKSTGWDSVKDWNWYRTRDIGHGNGHGVGHGQGHDYDQGRATVQCCCQRTLSGSNLINYK